MKNIALYGAGKKSQQMAKRINDFDSNIQCLYLIETKKLDIIGNTVISEYDNKKEFQVIGIENVSMLYKEKKIDAVAFPSNYFYFDWEEIYEKCLEMGISDDDILTMPIDMLKNNEIVVSDINQALIPYKKIPQICHLDIHVTDTCNLKCRGCGHFSCLVNDDTNLTAQRIRENVLILNKLVPYIDRIAILGGEPLLNPEIETIISDIRSIYANSKIVLTTNGILLTQMSESLISTIKKCNVAISISLYPLYIEQREKWENFCIEKEIEYTISECLEFERRLLKKPTVNGNETTKLCGHNLVLSDKFIGKCPFVSFIHYYNEYFKTEMPDDGRIDITSYNSGMELINDVMEKRSLCDFCIARDSDKFPWERVNESGANKNDWFKE